MNTEFLNPSSLQQMALLFNVLIAMVFGGIIGIEREYADKPAGLRTHMMVAGTAALLVGLTDILAQQFTFEAYSESLRIDPLRITEAIITGISFLGAGTIFRRQNDSIEGLTTAASILMVSAIGITIGLKQYWLAAGVTLLCFIVLRGIRFFESILAKRKNPQPVK